ncbi:hypothetical protein P692DRAFT_20839931 [Suillus brevipes Sb2]|nr:hypothetical protein P692DRAFT_20839931 [Suillus brevipes Sb2]
MGIGEGTDNWPKDPATGKDLIRFDWRVGKHDDSINTAGLQRVVDRIRLVGPQMGDAAKGILSAILPGQIEKNVQTKYMRMAGEYRKADKKRKRVDEDDDLGDDVEIVASCIQQIRVLFFMSSPSSWSDHGKLEDGLRAFRASAGYELLLIEGFPRAYLSAHGSKISSIG